MLRETKKVINKSIIKAAKRIDVGVCHCIRQPACRRQTNKLPTEQAFVVNSQPFGTKAYAALSDAIHQHSPEATKLTY